MYSRAVTLIKRADMFGADITLNIENKGQFTSCFGGFMTLAVWIVMLYVFIYEGINLINRVEQQAITRNINDINPNARILNSSNFMIGIKIEDPLQTIYNTTNQTMYNVTVIQYYITTYSNKTRIKSTNTSIILEQCTQNHFQLFEQLSEEDAISTYKDYACLPLDYKITLQGTYNNQIFQYTSIKVTACKNNSQCFTSDQLNTLAEKQTFKLSTLIRTTVINPFSNDQIINPILFQDFYQQTKKLQEFQSDIFLQPNQLVIDNSVFPFETDLFEGEYWSFELGNVRTFVQDYSEPTNFFTINLRLSSDYYSSFISFKKFSDFISYIGGLLKVVTSLVGIIVIKYNIIGFKLFLANTLYQCKIEEDHAARRKTESNDIFKFIQKEKEKAEAMLQRFRGSTKKLFQFNKVSGIFKSQRFSAIQKSDTDLLQNISQGPIKELDSVKMEPPTTHEYFTADHMKDSFIQNMVEQLLLANQKIKLGMNFILYYLSCLRHFEKYKKTYIVLWKATNKINNDLDIVLILQKLQEVNKLKQLLLNKSQLQLFNYIPSPQITWHNLYQVRDTQLQKDTISQKINACGKVQNYNTRNKLLKLFRAFEIVQLEEKEINTRLIESLGPFVQNVFHESLIIAQNYNKIKQEENNKKEIKQQPPNTMNTSGIEKRQYQHSLFETKVQAMGYVNSKNDFQDQGEIPFDS